MRQPLSAARTMVYSTAYGSKQLCCSECWTGLSASSDEHVADAPAAVSGSDQSVLHCVGVGTAVLLGALKRTICLQSRARC